TGRHHAAGRAGGPGGPGGAGPEAGARTSSHPRARGGRELRRRDGARRHVPRRAALARCARVRGFGRDRSADRPRRREGDRADAVQICRKFGATSIGTASSGKHERLRELGLSHAIDYRKLDFEQEVKRITGGRGVDIALDPVGTFRKSFRCLAPVGRLMMYGASATVSGERRNLFAALGTVLKMRWFHPLQLLPDNKGIFGVNMGQLWGETELLAREMREVLKGFSAGEFKAIVDQEVPFAEARRAHERLQARKNFGKVVLVP